MRKRTVAARVGNGLLTLASIGGVVCILSVLLAVFFSITLIMFKTGSMSPGIPAGSLAVVREIPASAARVGDVVTVDRPGALPITHRVTSATEAPGGLTSLTLRGDANPTEDPAPYLVSTVRIVLFSVPGLAYAVNALSNPIALGVITVAATAVVTWAFWPRAERTLRARRRAAHDGRGVRHAAAALLAVGVGAATLMPATPASAAITEETISGANLTLVSIADRDALRDLQPGVPVEWQVGVTAHPATPGTVELSLVGAGGLLSDATGLWITVATCTERWVASTCGATAVSVAGPAPASVVLGAPLPLGSMPTSQRAWILVQAELANSPVVRAGTASLSIIASGSGDVVVAGSDTGALARTGLDLALPLRAALGAVTVGLALAFAAGLWRRRLS